MVAESVLDLVLVADVGGSNYHLGDEALAQVAVEQLQKRGTVRFTVVTADGLSPFAGYSAGTVAPPRFDPTVGSAADAGRDVVLAGVGHTALAAAIRGADALLVAGGGNVCASWPHMVAVRVAALRIARDAGVPAVLTGQSVGPALTRRQQSLLAEVLPGAALVGCRDEASLALVGRLAPSAHAVLQLDDAVATIELPTTGLPARFVMLTTHDLARAVDTAVVADRLAVASGFPVVVMPNTDADVAVAAAVAAAATHPGVLAGPLLSPGQFLGAVRRAHLVVSSRFHPIVFALAAGVPCVAISSDAYTAAKLDGALAHAGMSAWRLPSAVLASRAAGELIDEALRRRSELADHLAGVTAAWPDSSQHHWADVWTALNGQPLDLRPCVVGATGLSPTAVDVLALQRLEAEGHSRLALAEDRADTAEEYAQSLREARDVDLQELANAREYALSLRQVLDARDLEIAALRPALDTC